MSKTLHFNSSQWFTSPIKEHVSTAFVHDGRFDFDNSIISFVYKNFSGAFPSRTAK